MKVYYHATLRGFISIHLSGDKPNLTVPKIGGPNKKQSNFGVLLLSTRDFYGICIWKLNMSFRVIGLLSRWLLSAWIGWF